MRDPSALQVESFLEMMSAERGAAVNTLQSYERDLEDANSFLNERSVCLTEAMPDVPAPVARTIESVRSIEPGPFDVNTSSAAPPPDVVMRESCPMI